MTVRESYNWCKTQRNKDAEVYLCKDWEDIDEDGYLTDLYRLCGISKQNVILYDGMDFVDVEEVILVFENERAQ